MKICNTCKIEKPVSDYPRDIKKNGIIYYRNTCKLCKKIDTISRKKNSTLSCSVPECKKLSHSSGLCNNHYRRMRLYGSYELPEGRTERSDPNSDFKICSKCFIEKPRSEFYSNKTRRCKICFTEKTRANRYIREYGITQEDYNLILEKQQFKCAICDTPSNDILKSGIPKNFAVDHDHESGRVRGLLCSNCNRGIGLLKDDCDLLHRAIEYLSTGCVWDVQRD